MKFNDKTLFATFACIAFAACTQTVDAEFKKREIANSVTSSSIVSESDAIQDKAEWGQFFTYHADGSHYLKPVLVGVAKIKAGQEIHPPHRHADEEYLMVTKGRGTWSLNGVESPAKEGDILFARAWDYHGIRADNDSPLEFVVFKYSAQSSNVPTDPDPFLPEEESAN